MGGFRFEVNLKVLLQRRSVNPSEQRVCFQTLDRLVPRKCVQIRRGRFRKVRPPIETPRGALGDLQAALGEGAEARHVHLDARPKWTESHHCTWM